MSQLFSDLALRQVFESDGFVVFPEFVCGEELIELTSQVDRFLKTIAPTLPPDQVFYEDKEDPTTLKQIQQMGDHDAWFNKLCLSSRFRTIAEFLLEGPVVPKNLQFFNKPPRVGQPTPAHQDGYYFMLDPCEAVTMWFALDEVDEENGCVRYVKGSHLAGMRQHARTKTLGFSQGIVGFPEHQDLQDEISCPAKSGDLLVHHALTIHRAAGNQSATRNRRALGFIYYSEKSRENRLAHQAYQRQLSEEMKQSGQI